MARSFPTASDTRAVGKQLVTLREYLEEFEPDTTLGQAIDSLQAKHAQLVSRDEAAFEVAETKRLAPVEFEGVTYYPGRWYEVAQTRRQAVAYSGWGGGAREDRTRTLRGKLYSAEIVQQGVITSDVRTPTMKLRVDLFTKAGKPWKRESFYLGPRTKATEIEQPANTVGKAYRYVGGPLTEIAGEPVAD